jgi:predicted Fe-Mo cluster-binding NifX family protein
MTSASDTVRIAVPSVGSGGLAAGVEPHFGRCQHFTVVELTDGETARTMLIENLPHHDCLQPVEMLAAHGVNVLVVQGIGMRPLVGFRQAGIDVYTGSGATVGDLIAAFRAGRLRAMDGQSACHGGRHDG